MLFRSAQVWVTEIDPINALQAAMEGYRVVTMDWAADKADIFVTTTGNRDVITYAHMAAMKDQAIVCNIGHFDNEIQVAKLEEKCQWEEVKPQVDHVIFPDGKKITLLADLGELTARGNPTSPFIQKLLEACKLTIDDIALVNTHREIPSLALLQQQLHPSVILLFGQDPAQLGLPIRFPEFKLQAHDSITFLLLPGLHAFLAEDESAKLLKSKLWVCLKSLFRL